MLIFTTVFTQVIILLVLICLGYILAKGNILNEYSAKGITEIVLLIVTPCVIIKSFMRKFDEKTLRAILISFLAAVLIHALFILMSHIIFRDKDISRRRVLQFGVIFTNCGYMSLPLQEAILGDDGVLYGASFVAIFNLIVWSYGIILMSGNKKYMSPKKLIFNPGIIGLAIGLIIFLLSIKLPTIISSPIVYLAALNTPLPMIIIGYHLSKSDLIKAIKDKACILAIIIRLIIMPFITLGILYLFGIRGSLLVAMTIAASAPCAAITTMFSAKFNQDTNLSVNMVSLSSVLSLITMPIIITIAQYIS